MRKLTELSSCLYSIVYARTKRLVTRGLLTPYPYARYSYNAGLELA